MVQWDDGDLQSINQTTGHAEEPHVEPSAQKTVGHPHRLQERGSASARSSSKPEEMDSAHLTDRNGVHSKSERRVQRCSFRVLLGLHECLDGAHPERTGHVASFVPLLPITRAVLSALQHTRRGNGQGWSPSSV